MKRIINLLIISSLLIALTITSCSPVEPQPEQTVQSVTSFYLLNEGMMGANNASLDYYNYQSGIYQKNFFTQVNPNIIGGLGDVGNDLQIYGSKMYAVINLSGLVEVMDAKTAKHIGTIEIPNCRKINFYSGKAYVSSFAGATYNNGNQIGFVAEIDTTTLQVLQKVNVGFQPEEIEFINGKMYVANSGGYNTPPNDNTISVVDLQIFTEIKKIDVAVNLSVLRKAGNKLFALSLGNYADINPDIYVIENEMMTKKLGIENASNFCISGDSIYILSAQTDWITNTTFAKYIIYNIKNQEIITENFITDGTNSEIEIPYGIAINPISKDIFITDAQQYFTSGKLFCFSHGGKKLWSVETGICPKYIAFLRE
ncbi:MAG: YncE family protein [Paludibacter sp.]|nr:YncE family protein [Paludibacter sp.]